MKAAIVTIVVFAALMLAAQASAHWIDIGASGGCGYPVVWGPGGCAPQPPEWPTTDRPI